MGRYSNPALAFECEIPSGWTTLPAPWARMLKLSASASSERAFKLLHENHDVPFLSLYPLSHDEHASPPMVQCTVRPAYVVEQLGGVAALLERVAHEMGLAYPDFVVEQQEECVIAGVAGVYMKASLTVLDEAHIRYDSISEIYLLETARHCFIIGLSGPADEALRPVADLNEFLRSIRIL